MLFLQNAWYTVLDGRVGRFPAQQLVCPFGLSSRIQSPADRLEPSLVKCCFLAECLLFRVRDVPQLFRLLTNRFGQIAPDMLSIFSQEISFCAPEFFVEVLVHSCFGEQEVCFSEIFDVDVVPSGFAFSNDWYILGGQDEFGEFVDLSSSRRTWSSTLAYDKISGSVPTIVG